MGWMAGVEGLEPPTHGLEIRCSIHLSYTPVARFRQPAAAPDDLMMVREPLPSQCLDRIILLLARNTEPPFTLTSWALESKPYGSAV